MSEQAHSAETELPLVLAMTGASGAPYAVRLLEVLLQLDREVFLTISPAAQQVIEQELGIKLDLERFRLRELLPETPDKRLKYCDYRDYFSPIASGSHLSAGMVVCPCSGSTMSAIAHGSSNNLIQRAADVQLKENRRLILVPRETPLSRVHLRNMLTAAEAGATILPAMPGWYHGVRDLQDLIDFIVARILDQLGIPHDLMKRWGAGSEDAGSESSVLE